VNRNRPTQSNVWTREGGGRGRLPDSDGSDKMINVHLDDKKGAPWWVAVGAPLVGVPLMVALLALASPQENASVGEPEIGARTELVEPQVVYPMELEAEFIDQHSRS